MKKPLATIAPLEIWLPILLVGPGCSGLYHSIFGEDEPTVDELVLAEREKELRKEPIAGVTNPRFRTDETMIAAAELLLAADPFFARFEELGWLDEGFDSRERLTRLGPAVSRYNMDHLVLYSGMGAPLTQSPHFNAGLNRRLLDRVGLDDYPVPNTRPLYLEYVSGDPHFVQYPEYGDPDIGLPPDAGTLRWNSAWFDRDLEPGTLGAALLAQTLWAKRLLWAAPEDGSDSPDADGDPPLGSDSDSGGFGTGEEDGSEEPDPIDDPFGELFEPIDDARTEVDDADRYYALQLLEIAANKIIALATEMAWDPWENRLGGMPETYRPDPDDRNSYVYFPHRIIEKEHYEPENARDLEPDELADHLADLPPGRFVMLDPKSHLFDQVMLLQALLEFVELADSSRFNASIPLFPNRGSRLGEPPVFTDTVPAMARRLSESLVRNIVGMHWDKKNQSLVSYAQIGELGRRLRTVDAGLASIALRRFADEPWASETLRDAARHIVGAQGEFLVRFQYRDGAFADTIAVEDGDAAKPRGFQLTSQMYAIRSLLEGYKFTGDFRMRQAAWRTWLFVEETLWAPAHDLYRVEDVVAQGQKHNSLTPLVVGATIGGLRELALASREFDVVERLVDFLRGVERSGLLMAELWPTGEEPGTDWDSDDDSILKPRFAGGDFGTAPVYASEVLVYIPSTGEIIPAKAEE